MDFLRKLDHSLHYFIGCAIIVVGLPFSNLLMSIGMIWLATNWVLEGNFKEKWNTFASNKSAVICTSLFVLHMVGLLYTSDFAYAFNDIKIKIPLLVMPLIMCTMPAFSKERVKQLLYIFVTAVCVSTIICFLVYLGVLFPGRYTNDVRLVSIFISHIRLGLMISFSIMILVYLFYRNHTKMKPVHALFAFWFVGFLYIIESFTGFTTLVMGVFILLIVYAFRWKEWSMKLVAIVVAGAVGITTFFFVRTFITDHYKPREDINALATHSPDGERYHHSIFNDQMENGYYVYKHIAPAELMRSWNERSDVPFKTGLDGRGHPISGTLVRYMTSKGLRKDKNGVSQLTDEDIRNIEAGIANIDYLRGGIVKRMKQLMFEIDVYINTNNPNGNSVTQRFEFWKTGWYLVMNNPIIGVGTGDTKVSFMNAYEENASELEEENRKRAHNQYLTFFITFGVIGGIWFLVTIFYPIVSGKHMIDFYFLAFIIIALLSFIWEDTLETQAGVTFFTFFFTLFLFGRKERDISPVQVSSGTIDS